MSEPSDIIDAILNQFDDYGSLGYIISFTKYEDEIELEEKSKFPFINIDIQDIRVEEPPGMNLKDMERRVYPIIITFSNRHKIKSRVKSGDSKFKGIFDIYEDIKSTIYSDRSFGNVVNRYPSVNEFSSDVMKYSNSQYWIGRAVMIFEVYKDVFI